MDPINFEPIRINATTEERAAASAVASLSVRGWKREREPELTAREDEAEEAMTKVARLEDASSLTTQLNINKSSSHKDELQPAPLYYYKDHSREVDPDPLTPLTVPGRVPNFPAKMMAILANSELADIVCWMPHGRSWRVLKPREFEIKVIPRYFDHNKFSSFIRQANGWGFRRITQGRDRNSYYHPLFLRGLPHLCKKMKRPGVSEKVATDPDHEPDFYKISEMYPVPEKVLDDSIILDCTVQGGPKARMPIFTGAPATNENLYNPAIPAGPVPQVPALDSTLGLAPTPKDQSCQPSVANNTATTSTQSLQQTSSTLNNILMPHVGLLNASAANISPSSTPPLDLAVLEGLALAYMQPQPPTAAEVAASQFVAGFAAATALSNNPSIRELLRQVSQQTMSSAPASSPTTAPVPAFQSNNQENGREHM